MIAWINVVVLAAATVLTGVYYVKSAGPAALERRIGESAYVKCASYRTLSAVFMTIAALDYVLYVFFPLPLSLSRTFPWPYWGSAVIAVVIAIPSGLLFALGMRNAGEETMRPKKEHTLYSGIYRRIRHPQAAGEVWFWWVIAFLCNSPALAIFSIAWLPIFHLMCRAEERDLVIRYGEDYVCYMATTGMYLPRRLPRAG